MLARSWDGATRAEHGDQYVEYLRHTGVADLSATAGNRGVFVLRREDGERTCFRLVSLWDSLDAIRGFAGDEPERARYYPEDERFLLALSPGVEHFEVVIGPDGKSTSTEGQRLAEEVRAIVGGDAWHGPALLELLDGVTAEQASARPVAAAHSLWELVLHMTAWTNVWRERLEGRVRPEPGEGDFPPVPTPTAEAWVEAQGRLLVAHQALADRVGRLTASDLDATVPGCEYDTRFLVRGVIRHTVHHGGQIALLKKGA